MSGHSKWSTIKRAKEANDAKRGNLFTKLGNNITVAAKDGGGDPETNFSLRLAIDRAKSANMPKDNIERAIKRGTGELKGDQIEEISYGGLLPGNRPIIIKCLTDNKNRTVTEVKTILQKNGGQLTDLNSVSWQFENKGVLIVSSKKINKKQEEIEMSVIESGADDYEINDDETIIYTRPEDLQEVKKGLEQNNFKIESAELKMVAKEKKELNDIDAGKVEKILSLLSELDDVSDYYTNIQ